MSIKRIEENVPRAHIEHPAPIGVENDVDVSTEKRSWRSYLWDTWDKSPEVRRLLTKVDWTLVTFGCLGTFIKFLDRQNLSTAFVSGMKEDLGFYGNQLIYANASIPPALFHERSLRDKTDLLQCCIDHCSLAEQSDLDSHQSKILHHVLGGGMDNNVSCFNVPSLSLVILTICNSTFAQSAMKTSTQMYVLRAILALFETGHYSAIMYLCGSWYQKGELSRRMAIVNMAAQAGPMFSAYLQTAAYSGLNGVNGMEGWQWLYIIDGVFSVGIIIPQFFLLPETPARLKPNWIFSQKEIELARDRMPKEGRVRQGRFTKTQIKRWFTTPEIWLLSLIAASQNIGYTPNQSLPFWFKAWNTIKKGSFTVQQINDYTTPLYAVTITVTTCMAWASDTIFKGRRWPMLILGGAVNFVVCILLATTPVFPKNRAFRWFLYYNTGWGEASNCMFWAWTSEILAGDPATRAFAGASLQVWSQVFAATIPLAVFQTVHQPAVKSGNFTAAGFWIVQIICALTLAYIQHQKSLRPVEIVKAESDSVQSEDVDPGSENVQELNVVELSKQA
ncbi:major facilitator superfamily domain-containing protein [Exophiala viscosa]|uniref:major facilitator superfamily domain-containing protein n=1 Tax=Exophiala viscosa TaxID=2486360 RepID=UPI0021A0505D|nr:major facilitator superfamily domain-containing protein [Exophiala viscosa]